MIFGGILIGKIKFAIGSFFIYFLDSNKQTNKHKLPIKFLLIENIFFKLRSVYFSHPMACLEYYFLGRMRILPSNLIRYPLKLYE